ncbi:MAG: nucleotidyltransferase [Actinobacteria bacterium HGW-Actinobacteria-4]|nr:MAG: nucleotidyltransferase [Actinobacteria bacterium HGW-Actinobacteria-4]
MSSHALERRDAARLTHIVGACERIEHYCSTGRSSLDDHRTYDAVLHCLTVIGEALGALSDDAYARLGSVPANIPKAQRNLIVHEYWRVDPEIIWATVERAIPALRVDATAALGT